MDATQIRQRHLPHWQTEGATYFVTFRSLRGALPDEALEVLAACLLRFHGVRHDLCAAVLLPDHAHVITRPRELTPGCWYDLGKLLKGIKGASARGINRLLGTRGHVWQDESFDRIIRDAAEFDEKLHYMWMNPIRLGLCTEDETYKFWIVPEDMQ